MIEENIKKIETAFDAQASKTAYSGFNSLLKMQEELSLEDLEARLGLKKSSRRKKPILKIPKDDGRIYANYFTNVILSENNKRIIEPMRYRIRPFGSEEIPSKYNVFNARLDALESRKTWKSVFMKNHGIIAFHRFFEWVEHDGKKKLISFAPENLELMWAPCLWDEWQDKTGKIHFKSFAVITDDPPEEVAKMGHDRCPIFLKEEYIDQWLNPTKYTNEQIYAVLKDKKEVLYSFTWAA